MRTAPLVLEEISEKQWQRTVQDLAKQLGWVLQFHPFDSRRSTHGWPDLALVRDRFLLLELKSERGGLREDQRRWLRALVGVGVECYVARPSQLQPLAEVLSSRVRVDGALRTATVEELG